jgi:putative tryptophan/tyrosine transport system substrate-binding protein
MRRREVIAALAGAAAWPIAARAQQPMPVVGFLNSASPGPFAHLAAGFRKGLGEEGFVEGRNIAIESRWAEGRYDRLPALAEDLVRQKVSVLAATGGAMSGVAAKTATETVPIVFVMGSDPVRFDLVASLNRPGGNITGISQLTIELGAKRLGLLHELVPHMKSVGILLNPDFPDASPQLREIEAASARAGLVPVVATARTEAEFAPAFATLEQARVDALLVGADPFFNSRRDQLIALAARQRIPTIYEFREFAEAGGLMSYGTDLADAYRLVGVYVGRVLKGARPADLPVVQAAKFELVINLTTAKALGIAIPPTLLARADEVIE